MEFPKISGDNGIQEDSHRTNQKRKSILLKDFEFSSVYVVLGKELCSQ